MTLDVDALYRTHERFLTSVSWRILRSAEDAREVCQETFARLLGALREGAAIRNPPAWLCRTAINLSIQRTRKKVLPLLPEPATPAATPTGGRELLDAAIQALPERQRVVFLLRHEEGMPLVDIAEMLGVAPSTVGVHLTRALRALRAGLAPHFEELR
ncbi:MAG: sigma-70 family RNA polymerase sigma factor [Planctomycetes bacterium]|nr:sigma-70 family RNA polymerase sigma factor [Planctomycetota bacterium]